MPKHISEKQRAANRANAKRSTGPRSRAGKEVVRHNAVRHGGYARGLLLPGDSAAEFQEMLEGIRAQLRPEGALDELIIQRVAAAHWRLRRAYRFEAEAIQELVDWKPDALQLMGHGMLGTTPTPPNASIPGAQDLQRMLRYETLIDRELARAMHQVHRLARHRPQEPAQAGESDETGTPVSAPATSCPPPAGGQEAGSAEGPEAEDVGR